MKYKSLNLKVKDEIKWPKLDGIPPKHGTPFFSNLVCGSRGQGKTYSVLEMMSNILDYNFYNVFFCISPTRKGDPKQKAFFNMIEEKGYDVFYYEEFDEKTLNEIKNILEQNIKLWREYSNIKKIVDKFKKKGEKNLNDNELMVLEPYLDEEYIGSIDDIFNQFPDLVKRDIPPCSYLFIDDCYGSRLMSKIHGSNPLTWLIIRHRHLYCSISLLVQSISNIPRAIRSNIILTIVFSTKSKKDLKVLYEENANIFNNEQEFKNIMQRLQEEEHLFLYMDTSSSMKPDIRIGFNNPI